MATPHLPPGPVVIEARSHVEILLTDFDFCLSCRAGACSKHHTINANTFSQSMITEADFQSTRSALALMTALPAELQVTVACQLDVAALFSVRHAPQFQVLWDQVRPGTSGLSHRSAIIRSLLHKFRAEADVFPQELIQNSKLATEMRNGHVLQQGDSRYAGIYQYLFFLEVIQRSTDAIVKFLIDEFRLCRPAANNCRWNILTLWRIFGITGVTLNQAFTSQARIDDSSFKRDVFRYFQSLSKPQRLEVLTFMKYLSKQYRMKHPIDFDARNVSEEVQRQLSKTGVLDIVSIYYIMELLRYGMLLVLDQVSNGRPANARVAFMRGGMAPWTMQSTGPVPADTIHFDPWTYQIQVRPTVFAFRRPQNHRVDFLAALCTCTRFREDDEFDWFEFARVRGGTLTTWTVPRHTQDEQDN